MYPSNHQRPMGSQPGLTRYVSAPGSLLSNLVDSVIRNTDNDEEEFSAGVGSEGLLNRYFSGDSSSLTTESSCKERNGLSDPNRIRGSGGSGTLERSYGLNQLPVNGHGRGRGRGGGGSSSSSPSPSPLIRHSSSPAGFFKNLNVENGFSITNGMGGGGGGYKYSHGGTSGNGIHGRLNTQLSFTRQDSLSQISEVGESVAGVSNSDEGHGNAEQSYGSGSFTMGPWADSNEIVFSNQRSKRAKHDIITGLSDIESQSLFNLPKTSSEMSNMERVLQMQSDSVPCRIRAKRGFATHPRSIAERERRGRISDNLRKLQELVPNMDKQTSTADMLDLAVQHIKGLQGDVQKLNKDLEKCSCECKNPAT